MANRIKISKETADEVRRVLAKARAEQKMLRERQKQVRIPAKPRVRIGAEKRKKSK
jgi:hypothetical protein